MKHVPRSTSFKRISKDRLSKLLNTHHHASKFKSVVDEAAVDLRKKLIQCIESEVESTGSLCVSAFIKVWGYKSDREHAKRMSMYDSWFDGLEESGWYVLLMMTTLKPT
jgi:hypothetical protein